MKKLLCVLLSVFTVTAFCACGVPADKKANRISVIATLFPQYDFVRQIAKDKADVTLLLPPGVESHTFDPSVKDMANIKNADIFVYTNSEMEPWAQRILNSVNSKDLTVLNVGEHVELIHGHGEEPDGHEDEDEHEEAHEHGFDPHIWLDLTNCVKIVDEITNALCVRDSGNESFYKQNAEEYKEKLLQLDQNIINTVEQSKNRTLVFGGRFAYAYFLKRYEINYQTAYDSCSEQSEPSVKKISEIIDYIKKNDVNVIFYEELSDPKAARSIANECKIEYLLFSTAHNLKKSEFESGTTFLDIMEKNLENIKKALVLQQTEG